MYFMFVLKWRWLIQTCSNPMHKSTKPLLFSSIENFSAALNLALSPKSTITMHSWLRSSFLIMIFSGFRSLWITSRPWTWTSPCKIPLRMEEASSSEKRGSVSGSSKSESKQGSRVKGSSLRRASWCYLISATICLFLSS